MLLASNHTWQKSRYIWQDGYELEPFLQDTPKAEPEKEKEKKKNREVVVEELRFEPRSS